MGLRNNFCNFDFFPKKFYLFIWKSSLIRSQKSESEVSKLNRWFLKNLKGSKMDQNSLICFSYLIDKLLSNLILNYRGGGCNTHISGLYNTNILTAITPGTLKIEIDDMTAITPGTLKFSMPKIFALSRDRVVL